MTIETLSHQGATLLKVVQPCSSMSMLNFHDISEGTVLEINIRDCLFPQTGADTFTFQPSWLTYADKHCRSLLKEVYLPVLHFAQN